MEAMRCVAQAHKNRSLTEFQAALDSYRKRESALASLGCCHAAPYTSTA